MPGVQDKQEVTKRAPRCTEKVPSGHDSQVIAPVALLNVPRAQGMQAAAPTVE